MDSRLSWRSEPRQSSLMIEDRDGNGPIQLTNGKKSAMKIAKLSVQNFRGISRGDLWLNGHSVLVGDNNCGKSTLLEAMDLVLGPERLSRRPAIDEHDFF